jgi:hypothetical protein
MVEGGGLANVKGDHGHGGVIGTNAMHTPMHRRSSTVQDWEEYLS